MATRWARAAAVSTLTLRLTTYAAAASPPSVAVVAHNQVGIAADALARAKTEITRIYGETGVGVTWIEPGAPKPAGVFAIHLLLRRRPVDGSGSVMGSAIGDA